ncbi:MAG: HlyD family efflux transporter periplasmic adaptor subunit, partial [Rhodoferax sp.]|nr:HlyD family efflux transporter periplasmic adaptor subunit [Rhodoferax sp.]
MKRILYLGAAALTGAALLAWVLLPGPRAVQTAPVTQGRFERSVLEDGRTRLQARYALSAPQAGQLGRIDLQAGDPVTRGQVVAELAPPQAPLLDARSRAEQQERIAAAQAALGRAQSNRERAAAATTLARNALARSESLSQQGFVSPAQSDGVRTELQLREQELAAARQDATAAAHGLAQARAT